MDDEIDEAFSDVEGSCSPDAERWMEELAYG